MSPVPDDSGLPIRAEHPRGPPREVPASPQEGDQSTGVDDEATRLRAELDRYVDALRRTTAEFDNYRKRMLREQTTHVERAEVGLVRHLLPVLDAAELGARHHPDTVGPVYRQLEQTLAAAGLRRIEPANEPFDPAEHEAVEHDPVVPLRRSGTDRATTIRPGYRLHGRLLRPALVRVHSG
jgi:molecular chaperone GrpE